MNGERKSPKQKLSGVVLPDWPALRGFTDCISGSIQLFDEVQRRFDAALLIPSDCALDICDRTLVILNALNAHSPWLAVRDVVLPRQQSPPCPLSSLRFDVLFPPPKPAGQIRPYPQGYRVSCWPMQRARLPKVQALVLGDPKAHDSWVHSTAQAN